MVYLNRIYTKTGDDGSTSLGNGQRLPKTHPRIVAYGSVDELNSVLGLARAAGLAVEMDVILKHVQNDLFDLGADLCFPPSKSADSSKELRIVPRQVEALEGWIDAATSRLNPLTDFVLPGGSIAASHLHHARTVCRRVEIEVLRLAEQEPINAQAAIYLNRLSDLLFVLARLANDEGRADVLWIRGAGRGTNSPESPTAPRDTA